MTSHIRGEGTPSVELNVQLRSESWTGFAMLVGAELNSELAKISREGKTEEKHEPSSITRIEGGKPRPKSSGAIKDSNKRKKKTQIEWHLSKKWWHPGTHSVF